MKPPVVVSIPVLLVVRGIRWLWQRALIAFLRARDALGRRSARP